MEAFTRTNINDNARAQSTQGAIAAGLASGAGLASSPTVQLLNPVLNTPFFSNRMDFAGLSLVEIGEILHNNNPSGPSTLGLLFQALGGELLGFSVVTTGRIAPVPQDASYEFLSIESVDPKIR